MVGPVGNTEKKLLVGEICLSVKRKHWRARLGVQDQTVENRLPVCEPEGAVRAETDDWRCGCPVS